MATDIILTSKEELTEIIQSSVRKIFSEQQSSTQIELPDIVPIEEAMKITNLARATIYCLVHEKKIPFYKKGKKLLFSRKKLFEWIQAGNDEEKK